MISLIIPFLGTTIGAACVFFLSSGASQKMERFLLGFASGVMVAASVWSLLLPAIERSEDYGKMAFLPASIGFFLGVSFLMLCELVIEKMKEKERKNKEIGMPGKPTSMLVFAVTLHNIPEGLAVGVGLAAALAGEIPMTAAVILALGIGIQNFPEGAIISMPLRSDGMKKGKAFLCGTASGMVEPVASVMALLFTRMVSALLPYCLSFAAGAMIFAVVSELIPEACAEGKTKSATWGVTAGFLVMMILDVALG